MKKPITKKGYDELLKKLKQIEEIERPQNIRDIAEARDHGDIRENAEFAAAKEKQSFIESKINEYRNAVNNAQIIEIKGLNSDSVIFGATVHLLNINNGEKRVYSLVGEYETDIDNGRISINSPIARALIKRQVGEIAQVNAPGGIFEYEIKAILFEE
ncbi:MAG: transcription elongation factor GreA [Candidatus Schekmanbacteria bacterium RBG_16_38_11]|uniref:Transcription elongation factor GreA n=2 Tax=Candidatus Schekmaniibacteriota TaxID=1817811 RepID=A0A1F7RD43_9BACT|nr:MAG: transcription elongation factor GreA [Candidatus Schekmanbacteria bacterium GWA2_38_11]OGL46979.1 MAG: transcription elongation factor GreA [Candidatus Schekmanbacteria bacterium RBG_16_38_11]